MTRALGGEAGGLGWEIAAGEDVVREKCHESSVVGQPVCECWL